MIKKKKIDESLSLSGRIRNIILCFMCFRNHGQQFSEGEMRMKKRDVKGTEEETAFYSDFYHDSDSESEHDCVYLVSAQGVSYDISAGIVDMKQKRILTVWGYGKRV